jgi:hypothetical protein
MGLHLSTSAGAPRFYAPAVIDDDARRVPGLGVAS